MSPEFIEKWEHILEDVDKNKIPVEFIKKLIVKINGKKQDTCQKNREIELVKWVKYYEKFENIQGYNLSVQYLFYTDGDNTKLHEIEPYGVLSV